MSIFDWYNPSAQTGTLAGIKSNIGQMANLGADAGNWISGLFRPNAHGLFGNAFGGPATPPGDTYGPTQPKPLTDAPIPPGVAAFDQTRGYTPGPSAAGAASTTAGKPLVSAQKTSVTPQLSTQHIGENGLPYYLGGDTMPAPGTSEYQKLQSMMANLSPVNYNIGSSGNIDSSSMNPATVSDAMNARTSAASSMLNGTGSGIPSTSFLQNLFSNYQTSANDYTNTLAAANAQRLAELNQVYSLYTQNGITKQGRDSAINDINTRYGNTLGQLEVQAQSANANMDAYSRFYQTFMSPHEVSPGSSLVTPLGQTIYQGTGAAPVQIADLAQQAYSRDVSLGQPKLTPDGQIDWGYYGQQAQAMVSAAGGQSVSSPYYNPMGSPAAGSAQASPGPVSQGYGGGIQALPQALQSYADTSTFDGKQVAYFNADRIPDALKPAAQAAARQAGIPYLTNNDVQGVQAVQVISDALDQAEALSIKTLGRGLGGRIGNTLMNWANNILQIKPELSGFNVLRDTAAKSVTALAGGVGSGLRLNTAEIGVAVNNMPTANDNLETALAKINNIRTLLNNQISTKFPQFQGQGSLINGGQSQGAQSSGSSNPFSPSNFYGQ